MKEKVTWVKNAGEEWEASNYLFNLVSDLATLNDIPHGKYEERTQELIKMAQELLRAY